MKLSEATITEKLKALAELDGFKVGKMNDGKSFKIINKTYDSKKS